MRIFSLPKELEKRNKEAWIENHKKILKVILQLRPNKFGTGNIRKLTGLHKDTVNNHRKVLIGQEIIKPETRNGWKLNEPKLYEECERYSLIPNLLELKIAWREINRKDYGIVCWGNPLKDRISWYWICPNKMIKKWKWDNKDIDLIEAITKLYQRHADDCKLSYRDKGKRVIFNLIIDLSKKS